MEVLVLMPFVVMEAYLKMLRKVNLLPNNHFFDKMLRLYLANERLKLENRL